MIVLCISVNIEVDEELEEESIPVWREMKTIVRKTKKMGQKTFSYIRYINPGYESV